MSLNEILRKTLAMVTNRNHACADARSRQKNANRIQVIVQSDFEHNTTMYQID